MPDLAVFLAGSWRIVRRIHDQRLGMLGRLTGIATFAPAPGGLRYEEQGTLIWGAYRGHAVRRYEFAITGSASAEVRFDDGCLFHHLDLSRGVAEVAHLCPPDRYRGRYRISGQDHWTVAWQVCGPRKRLALATRYVRHRACPDRR